MFRHLLVLAFLTTLPISSLYCVLCMFGGDGGGAFRGTPPQEFLRLLEASRHMGSAQRELGTNQQSAAHAPVSHAYPAQHMAADNTLSYAPETEADATETVIDDGNDEDCEESGAPLPAMW